MRRFLPRLCLVALLLSLLPAPSFAEVPPGAVLATLPFADAPITRVAVDLAPAGQKPFVMMLDTGAADSVVTPLMARTLGVRVRRIKSTPYRRKTVLGRDLQFWVDTQSSDTGSKTGWEYGLLGGEFLDDYVLEIDYPGRRVRFLDRKEYRVPESVDAPDERVLEVRKSGTRIFTELGFEGGDARLLLDTGAPLGALLSGDEAKKVGIDVDALPVWGKLSGVLGDTEARLYEAPSLSWGGFEFEQVPVLVAPRGFYNQGGSTDSLLGYDLLRQFTIRIDYRKKRIWLRRGEDRRTTFFGDDYAQSKAIGASLMQVGPGQFYVTRVVPDGRSAARGIREGDVVVGLEGDPEPTLEQVGRRILEGESLTVVRSEGELQVDVEIPALPAADGGGTNAAEPQGANAAGDGP